MLYEISSCHITTQRYDYFVYYANKKCIFSDNILICINAMGKYSSVAKNTPGG